MQIDFSSVESCKNLLKNQFNVSRETLEKIETYINTLWKWNMQINLISAKTVLEIWYRHVLDCMQIIKHLQKDLILTILDVGSGNGFPGILLGILTANKVILIETITKKCIFLLEVVRILKLMNVTVICDRVENIKISCDVLTSRAFSKIDGLLACVQNINIRDRILVFKGKNREIDLVMAQKKYTFDYTQELSIINDNSTIITLTNIKYVK